MTVFSIFMPYHNASSNLDVDKSPGGWRSNGLTVVIVAS